MIDTKIYLYYFFAYISFIQVTLTNSNSCFKLEKNKIIKKHDFIDRNAGKDLFIEDSELQTNLLFDIISSTTTIYNNFGVFWVRRSEEILNERIDQLLIARNNTKYDYSSASSGVANAEHIDSPEKQDDYEILDCGKPVNFTYYDHLIGVAERFNHPPSPEPDVINKFLKKTKGGKSIKNFDIDALERRLKKAKREKPRSVQLYNQIGNFWRIKGDARLSIECFRRALAVSPSNAEVLLNLARVLYNLQYLDDAIHLTRRSLEVQPPDRSAWKQYFTLGEIFKSYGHFQESILHLKHALELFPGHEKIKQALRDVENIPTSSLHVYTILIIIFLILCVLLVIVSSTDGNQNTETETKIPRIRSSFNRAIAMSKINTQRSIRRK